LALGINLTLTLALIWPLAERGLALSTAAAASVQAILLALVFSRGGAPLAWRELASTIVKGTVATAAMALVVLLVNALAPLEPPRSQLAAWLALTIGAGASVYLATAWLLGMPELSFLLRHRFGSERQSRPVSAGSS
jgi:putative peptidoglycan lipid II flippase